jgi:hypothetical protein
MGSCETRYLPERSECPRLNDTDSWGQEDQGSMGENINP